MLGALALLAALIQVYNPKVTINYDEFKIATITHIKRHTSKSRSGRRTTTSTKLYVTVKYKDGTSEQLRVWVAFYFVWIPKKFKQTIAIGEKVKVHECTQGNNKFDIVPIGKDPPLKAKLIVGSILCSLPFILLAIQRNLYPKSINSINNQKFQKY